MVRHSSSSFPRHHRFYVHSHHRVHHSPHDILHNPHDILSIHGHSPHHHSFHTSPRVQALLQAPVQLTSSSFPRFHSLHILCGVHTLHSLHSLHSLYTRDRIHHGLHMLSMSARDQHLAQAQLRPRPQR